MSAVKKLCSIIFKSSRSIVTLKKRELYTTNCETLSSLNVVVMTNVQNRQLVSGGYQVKNYSQALGTLTKDQAHDLVFRLNEEERTTLYNTLEQFQMKEDKVKMESQLAGNKWRSRFGRPTKVDTLGEVIQGQYCKMPEDWLQKKIVAATPKPKNKDLLKLCIMNSLPFIGFGFLDNFTMIIAGDYIEYSLGTFMTISTMAAAALGNTISDVLGIGSAVYVERIVEIIGIKPPDLTPIQLEMKSARRASNLGRVLGITVGCLLGMLPLLFFKSSKSDKKEKSEGEEEQPKKENDSNIIDKKEPKSAK